MKSDILHSVSHFSYAYAILYLQQFYTIRRNENDLNSDYGQNDILVLLV